MSPLLTSILIWGGCIFWLSVAAFGLWVGAIELKGRRRRGRHAVQSSPWAQSYRAGRR